MARECRESGDDRHAMAYDTAGAAWSAAARDVRLLMMELEK